MTQLVLSLVKRNGAGLITAVLVADIFDVPTERVGKDVWRRHLVLFPNKKEAKS
jgi:hypothetical protein